MAADDLSPVILPPVAPAGDAPPRDSRRGSPDKNDKKGKNDSDRRPEKSREQKSPPPEVDFERSEHEFDGFA